MEPRPFSFENLKTGQKARVFTQAVYSFSRQFPPEEKYGLILQLRRASISICSNLAEGSGNYSPKEKAHYTSTAFSSLMEAINQIILAHDLDFLNHEQCQDLRAKAKELSRMLSGLRDSQSGK